MEGPCLVGHSSNSPSAIFWLWKRPREHLRQPTASWDLGQPSAAGRTAEELTGQHLPFEPRAQTQEATFGPISCSLTLSLFICKMEILLPTLQRRRHMFMQFMNCRRNEWGLKHSLHSAHSAKCPDFELCLCLGARDTPFPSPSPGVLLPERLVCAEKAPSFDLHK